MSALRVLTGIWRNHDETSDRAKLKELRTRYYKNRKDRVIEAVLEVIDNRLPHWKIIHVDRERGEIMAEKKQMLRTNDIVISVIDVGPMRSAVDVVSAARDGFGDLGGSFFTIVEFYNALHKEIQPDA